VPFDIAFSLHKTWRRAFSVAIGELEGRHYNWQALAWEP
jgi:hypothetical protein